MYLVSIWKHSLMKRLYCAWPILSAIVVEDLRSKKIKVLSSSKGVLYLPISAVQKACGPKCSDITFNTLNIILNKSRKIKTEKNISLLKNPGISFIAVLTGIF